MPGSSSSTLVFFVNGKKVVEKSVEPEWTLLYYLRNKLRLCGTKLGCGEGGCGACTVMVSRYDRKKEKILHYSVNACLAPVCSMHGLAVTTVEGIGSTRTRLHPVQERIAKSHGSQCGFCTPGIVMSVYTLLRNKIKPDMEDIEVSCQGNLCRCTGYRPILEGFKSFTEERIYCSNGEMVNSCYGNSVCNGCSNEMTVNGCCKERSSVGCCFNQEEQDDVDEDAISDTGTQLFDKNKFQPYDPSQEPIFPPELQLSAELDTQYLKIEGKNVTWFRPTTLQELLHLKASHPEAKMVVGNTEVGIETKFKNLHYPMIIQPSQVSELNDIAYTENGVKFGASVTLTEMEETLRNEVSTKPEYKTRVFSAVLEMLRWFAGKQIRNVAAVGGNIMTGSPISDLNPIFMAAGCELEVGCNVGNRIIVMDGSFFTGYRKNIVKAKELLLSIHIPYMKENEYFYGYKQARRRDDDIAIVNAGMRVEFQEGTNIVKNMSLAFGGMAPTTVMAKGTMKKLIGRYWNDSIVDEACKSLMSDLPLPPGVPGGMPEYRNSLALSFFFKFYLTVLDQLQGKIPNIGSIPDNYKSAIPVFHKDPPKSSQYYQLAPSGQPSTDPVGRPIPHQTAMEQASGEAVYCDDMPRLHGELYLALVLSTRAHAKILSVDPSKALAVEKVHDFISAKDCPGIQNITGDHHNDETIFASEKVTCHGQVIAAVVAEDQATAQKAAKLVEVQYEDIQPIIITIEDAIKAKSYYDCISTIKKGNIEKGFQEADHVLEGEMRIGGQEHFYLECHTVIAVPKGEQGEMEIYCCTQNPHKNQILTAKALGIPANRIVCKVKRLGGAFGGKETRSTILAIPVAIAARKLNRPVRSMLDRDEDMVTSGGRHPFLGRYKVGFTKNGKITTLKLDLYSNCGNSIDLSYGVMDRALFHSDNSYKIPNICVTGYCCKTNLPSNTAFRGFGGPQGMLVCENWIHDVATYLKIDPLQVRSVNMYKEGEVTHFNQTLTHCTLQRCWSECIHKSDFHLRRKEINQYNRENRWKKRGHCVIPTKFGISFTATFMNQTGALVMVYTDGSVLISHGGTEMGQGLHIKMIQVASRTLRIPQSHIHIMETSTDKVPNTSPSAASASSDLNGMAIKNACTTIMERLEPYMAANSKGTWNDWVKAAYFDRVSLSATGFYRIPDIGYNMETNTGMLFNYFTYGVACSEVEIDCLTGDHLVIRTDIVMDIGESLNPAIDIGQIEGGFTQGYGLFTLEELVYSPSGLLYTRGPGAYKIPGFTDIPGEFNVSLLKGAPNPRAVFSSKAIGEPPLFLAASVFYAIKDAITAARVEVGLSADFRLDSPATAERIRMGCSDQFTQKFPPAKPGTFKPWCIKV